MMLLQLLFFVSLFLLLFLLHTKQSQNGAKPPPLKHPPGPKGLPLLGNFHQFKATGTHLYLSQLSKIYGPIVSLRLGCVPVVVVSSAKLAKEVLRNQDHIFCSRQPLAAQKKLSYNGLDIVFGSFNDYWREMRKICITHLFSPKRVQLFSPVRREEIVKLMDEIHSLASSAKVVNLNELVMSLSSSIICRIGFGKKFGDDERSKRGSRFYNMLVRAQFMFMSLFFSDYFPYMGWLDKFTGASRRLEKVFKELDEFYQELIDEHIDPNRKKPEQEDIIDVLLELRKQNSLDIDIGTDNIKAVLMNIFIAGTETTVATVTWAMTELMKNPNAMKKVQEEVRTLIREQGCRRTFIEEEDLHQLSYLKSVVKETFRLHPATPLLVPHHTLENCTLDGYHIEAGTTVFVNAWAIGRDPESWEDPETFLPERFSGSPIDFRGRHFELVPFGAGRRICPGMLMGSLTVELTLANLLCWFDWELPDGMTRDDIDMDVLPGIAVMKKNALCLRPTIPVSLQIQKQKFKQ